MFKTLALIMTLAGCIHATERVTMNCILVAVADGYVDQNYEVKMILKGDELYNQDGSIGQYDGRDIYSDGIAWFDFNVYDGFNFHRLSASRWKIGEAKMWQLNIGEVACAMTKGWKE